MNKTGIPYLELGWNPCGFGCSKGCDGCWAQRMAHRMSCPDCQAFKPHFHPERLVKGFTQKKPTVVGVQFTGDLFDKQQDEENIFKVLDAALANPQHTYVFLTQQYQRASDLLSSWVGAITNPDCTKAISQNWFIGTTCRSQAEYDKAAECFSGPRWNWWVSAEPLKSVIASNGPRRAQGIIIGCDNRRNYACPTALISRTAVLFSDTDVYVKQLYKDGKVTTDMNDFPDELKLRDLPWEDVRKTETLKSGLKVYIVGNPLVWPINFKPTEGK